MLKQTPVFCETLDFDDSARLNGSIAGYFMTLDALGLPAFRAIPCRAC